MPRGGGELRRLATGPLAKIVQEMLRQRADVVGPLAQRRQFESRPRSGGNRDPRGTSSVATISARFWFVAAISRASVWIGLEPPTRTTTFSSSTRSSFACPPRLKSPISSRNSVPPEASSNLPGRDSWASVKAPFSCPNNSLSSSVSVNGRAVDGDKRLVAPMAEVMDRLGDHLLAGAVFAQDQHRQVGVGHAANRRAQGLDRRAFADRAAHPAAACSVINRRDFSRSSAFLDVFQRHGRLGRQLDERRQIVIGEVALLLVDRLESPEQLAHFGPEAARTTRSACGNRSARRPCD